MGHVPGVCFRKFLSKEGKPQHDHVAYLIFFLDFAHKYNAEWKQEMLKTFILVRLFRAN